MAPKTAMTTGTIRLNLVDGSRQPLVLPENKPARVRVLDGRKQLVADKSVTGFAIPITGLPFHDNNDDLYTVIVSVEGFEDAALFPVRLKAGHLVDAFAMMMRKDGAFHFVPFKKLKADAGLSQLVDDGSANAADRFSNMAEFNQDRLGALLVIGTAIRDIPLVGGKSPMDFFWRVIWETLSPDRFFAWVDARLVDRIKELADLHSFAAEPKPETFHPGLKGGAVVIAPATRSWKQTRFDVSNVQLTFHETERRKFTREGQEDVDCVIVEPDIDYFRDLVAHGLLEVLPNTLKNGKTDARQAYSLRWMATKLEGVKPDFNPPCTVE